MATIERAEAPACFVLYDISWETYELLLRDLGDSPSPRVTYDRGRLEFMSPTDEHEWCKQLIGTLVVLWAIERRIPQRALGSMTIRQRRMLRGLEPDQCYYVQNELAVRGKRKLDLSIDPPPDLAIEIDISRSSLEKLEIYAALGVPEVWLFDGDRLEVRELTDNGTYLVREVSLNLPGFPIAAVPQWIDRAFDTDETTWAISFQEWMQQQSPKAER
jgi:Uma2 family endonuclease